MKYLGTLLLPLVFANTLPVNADSDIFGSGKRIGAPQEECPFYPDYLTVFKISYDVTLGHDSKAAFIYGADDPRLMNPDRNIYNLQNGPAESFIAVELEAPDSVRIYRSGYHPADFADRPAATFHVDSLNCDGRLNHVEIRSNFGHTEIIINGRSAGNIGINPIGNGGDYIAFPALAKCRVKIPEGSEAKISGITVSNLREPGNPLMVIQGEYSESSCLETPIRSMTELQTTFSINPSKTVSDARIDVTARGIYDIVLNGRRVTTDYFNPGSTQYNKTHFYQTYDITHLLKSGNNILTATLGEGWWSGPSTFVGENWNFFGDTQSMIANITVNYTDGTNECTATSPDTWTVSTDGPVVTGSFFQGEVIDATKADSCRTWKKAVEVPLEGHVAKIAGDWSTIRFVPSLSDKVTAVDTLTAMAMTCPRPGVYVYDMGQNFAGVPRIAFPELRPGTEISMRYAEVLYPDMDRYKEHEGMVMMENIRAAMSTDKYRTNGEPAIFSPRFTLHGYRYMEITGLDRPLPLSAVKGIALSSIPEIRAHFECSDTLVNRLWENIKWSTLSNFISIPTDCAQRNERLGWMGDISVYSPTATKIADIKDLLTRYLMSVRDCTQPDGRFPDVAPTGFGFGSMLWGSAGIIVPWEHFRQYGDIDVIREHYPAMQRYVRYLLDNTFDNETKIMVQNRQWVDLGDWLSPVYERDDKSLLWECYFIYELGIMSEFARLLGDTESAEYYDNLRNEHTEFFNNTYIDHDTGKTIHSSFDPDRTGQPVDTQTSYALPIAFGITDNPKVIENFINTLTRENKADDGTVCPPYSLMTGFIGTAWISKALSKAGRNDIAYRLLTSTAYPSWLYPVTQGATTVWERLNSFTLENGFGSNNSMNSFNHYSFGAVADWLLTRSLGINASYGNPGLIEITPEIDPTGNITYAKGYLDTLYGRVESEWSITDDRVIYTASVPDGVEAIFKIKGTTPVSFKNKISISDKLPPKNQSRR